MKNIMGKCGDYYSRYITLTSVPGAFSVIESLGSTWESRLLI